MDALDALLPLLIRHPEIAEARRDGEHVVISASFDLPAPPEGPFFRPGDAIPDAGPIARVVDGTTIRMGPG